MATLSDSDVQTKLHSAEGWQRADVGGKPGIEKTFKTGSFLKGLALVTHVAVLAEKAGHHPDVTLTYPKVTLQLTTHDAGGLTDKDFALAAEINGIAI
jgi:4a-hydroxytetrahydrobiopterin dehydratase